jgi:hypothetical protein
VITQPAAFTVRLTVAPSPSPAAPPRFQVGPVTRAQRRIARLGGRRRRPTRYTPAWQAAFVGLLRDGNFRSTASRATGIGVRTTRWWLQCGRAGVPPFQDLLVAVETAEAEAEWQMMRYITTQMPTRPGLALALLASRFPERFSPRVFRGST